MPWVGFEPMITAFERVKKVNALDRSATVTGIYYLLVIENCIYIYFDINQFMADLH
jgi:hypothetical protein